MKPALRIVGLTLLTLFIASASVRAQTAETYPSRTISIVVPFPPGGLVDIIARVMAPRMQEALGQSVVVENRPGATGNIGAAYVARARPDGHTLLLGTHNTHGGNPALYKVTGYDAVADFQPISLLADQLNSFAAFVGAPFNSVTEMVEHARRKPDDIRFATVGNGSGMHIEMELLQRLTGTKMTHVPYKGMPQALISVVSGETQVLYAGLPGVARYVKDGKLKLLAVDGGHRQSEFSNVPTTAEAGYPNLEITVWYGMFAPAHTPRPIVDRLHRIIIEALRDPSVRSTLEAAGFRVRSSASPDEFTRFVKTELGLWADRVKKSGAQIE